MFVKLNSEDAKQKYNETLELRKKMAISIDEVLFKEDIEIECAVNIMNMVLLDFYNSLDSSDILKMNGELAKAVADFIHTNLIDIILKDEKN